MAKDEDHSDEKALTLELQEKRLQQSLVRAESEERAIESSLWQLAIAPNITSDEEEEGRQVLLQEFHQRQASNEVLRKICEKAISRLSYERTGYKIRGLKAERERVMPWLECSTSPKNKPR